MFKSEAVEANANKEGAKAISDANFENNKCRNRGKKRKRDESESSSGCGDELPENVLEIEKSLHASAVKNNLDETSVRKILRKVVTNDRVLALVKLREEEELGKKKKDNVQPKLTRSKVKELMKVSPKTATWNLELTPIKHIPVKTRPEVKALIAQELPEDEDDEEYEPTHEDVPSDDEHGLESCSDLDSQPRTPATPRSFCSASPKVVTDGPFKVPQEVTSLTRRKLELEEEEEATIALRTRSKLSLSATSIEHIESTFVPPDEIPPPVDDLWDEFLQNCLNPASTSKNEDDDETDPEYNVAADPDAHDEDEENISNSIIKISKKELNDLVTELFNIMPEATGQEFLAEDLANTVLTDTTHTDVSIEASHWEGKQEPLSDDEGRLKISDRLTFEKRNSYTKFSIGKSEPEDATPETIRKETDIPKGNTRKIKPSKEVVENTSVKKQQKTVNVINMVINEKEDTVVTEGESPAIIKSLAPKNETVCVSIEPNFSMLPEQILILQQQLRQHVQLSTSNFLQLYVHPMHWKVAPTYKGYLQCLDKLVKENENSVANVCNLKPAIDLVYTWENTVGEHTPENMKIVNFILEEAKKCRKRYSQNNIYVGDFHPIFKDVIANSSVFLYPQLLPNAPYRTELLHRAKYLLSEDEYIVLGIDQWWQYIESNPQIFKFHSRPHPRRRVGFAATLQLVTKYMLPWLTTKQLMMHVHRAKRLNPLDNPIRNYFEKREIKPVQHMLLPFNPSMTLYEQPEHEVPLLWLRHLATNSKRFKSYVNRFSYLKAKPSAGVPIKIGEGIATVPIKTPLPIDFTKKIECRRKDSVEEIPEPFPDKYDIKIQYHYPTDNPNVNGLDETSTGSLLIARHTSTVNCKNTPICASQESAVLRNDPPNPDKEITISKITKYTEHCRCCVLLTKITKRQTLISEFFKKNGKILNEKKCYCKSIPKPRISNKLKYLVDSYKSKAVFALQELQCKIDSLRREHCETTACDVDDLAYVTSYQLQLTNRISLSRKINCKKRIYNVMARFDTEKGDPLKLTGQLFKMYDVELMDLHKDFLGFLTAEQADSIGFFKDYFVRTCVNKLVKKIEEEVSDVKFKKILLDELQRTFSENTSSACEICCSLLNKMTTRPALARFTFSLFPHSKNNSVLKNMHEEPSNEPENTTTEPEYLETDNIAPNPDEVAGQEEQEAHHSSSGEDESNKDRSAVENSTEIQITEEVEIKTETMADEEYIEIEISKAEDIQDYCESSNLSLVITMSEEEIKTEEPEWRRDEDKLILETIKDFIHLTSEERMSKTLIELMDEKNVIEEISVTLKDKSVTDVRARVLYLLEVLNLS